MSQWVSNNRGISQHCSSPAPSLLAVMDGSLSLLPWKWFQFCVSAPRLPASPHVSKRQTSPRPLWKKALFGKHRGRALLTLLSSCLGKREQQQVCTESRRCIEARLCATHRINALRKLNIFKTITPSKLHLLKLSVGLHIHAILAM